MAVSISRLHAALVMQANELTAPELLDQPQTLAQQLLYQSRIDPNSAALAGPATVRLRELAGRSGGVMLRTRWSTSMLRQRIRPNRGRSRVCTCRRTVPWCCSAART